MASIDPAMGPVKANRLGYTVIYPRPHQAAISLHTSTFGHNQVWKVSQATFELMPENECPDFCGPKANDTRNLCDGV